MKITICSAFALALIAGALVPATAEDASPAQAAAIAAPVLEEGSKVFATAEQAAPLQPGAKIPDVTVTNVEGEEVSLKDALGGQPTILIFYRGGWCPFCTTHLAELAAAGKRLERSGYRFVGISPDPVERLKKTIEEKEISYTLLSDQGHEAARAFGIAFQLDQGTVQRYGEYGIPLSAPEGMEGAVLPVPSVFMVNPAGEITFTHSDPDYKQRLSIDGMLEQVRAQRRAALVGEK